MIASDEPSFVKKIVTMKTAWVVWGFSALFYFSDYLARVAPGVMHQQLQHAFAVTEVGFGIITASFYIPYIMMQLPVGLAVDRSSVRLLLTTMSIVTAIGCCIFGLASTLFVASVGRVFIGFSAAFAFVCTLRLATTWFPPAMLGLLAGLTQALGMLGAATGEAPVALLVDRFGWRQTMLLIALLFVVLAALLYRYVQDRPSGEPGLDNQRKNATSMGKSLQIILLNKQTWYNALYAGLIFGPTAVLGEAIGPAYLQFGRGLDAHTAAFATGLVFIGWGIGGPLTGWLSDKMGRRKPLMVFSATCGVVLSSLLVFIPDMGVKTAYSLFFLFGLTNTGVCIAYAVATELHERSVIGTAIAFTNMGSIFIGALLQPLVGYFVDLVAGARAFNVEKLLLSDFQNGLQILPICSLIALFLVFRIKETYCVPVK